ncbi:MAG: hypothetical protein L3K26_08040 [Candidatus Hydrogenedentes bacterium]|nr:hypothetical protein [Candidatus Hydrogenedentota bacterium]
MRTFLIHRRGDQTYEYNADTSAGALTSKCEKPARFKSAELHLWGGYQVSGFNGKHPHDLQIAVTVPILPQRMRKSQGNIWESGTDFTAHLPL